MDRRGKRILTRHDQRLRAQQVVGILAAPGVSLEILPKIDGLEQDGTRINLVHMLARTLDLKIADGALTAVGWQRHDILEILIRLFSDKLLDAIHRGLPRRYVRHENDLPTLRGRNNVKRQYTVLAASPHRLASRYAELSANIPINQILKAAVTRLRIISRVSENQRRLNELEFALAGVASLPVEQLGWKQVVLDRTNTAYHDLLRLATALLRNHFQTTGAGENLGFSLLFAMNRLFEEFIGRTMRNAIRDTGLRVTLQGPQNYALSDVQTNRNLFVTKPDIVVHRGDTPVIVIDAKWKRLSRAIDDPKHGVSQPDVYQMMAYAHVYQVKKLLLIYPHHDELGTQEGILGEYKIMGTESSIAIATLNLSKLGSIANRIRAVTLNFLDRKDSPSFP